jgi:hypothetical protein
MTQCHIPGDLNPQAHIFQAFWYLGSFHQQNTYISGCNQTKDKKVNPKKIKIKLQAGCPSWVEFGKSME